MKEDQEHFEDDPYCWCAACYVAREKRDEERLKYKEVVDAILNKIKDKHNSVGVFPSAVELEIGDDGYTFLYDFAMAVLEERKGE